jgi:hypothetical protein
MILLDEILIEGDDSLLHQELVQKRGYTGGVEGGIVHQTTVEDPDSPTGRRVERIVREGPISLFITTTGDLHAEQETRMLPFHVSESQEQTRGVIDSLASRVAGDAAAPSDLSAWHDLQRWIAYGPNDAIIPFARQIASKIPPAMVRFRRDVGSLFSFVKAAAILHQAQRQKDSQGRVIATIADYALAYPIFSKIMAQSSGQRGAACRLLRCRFDRRTRRPGSRQGEERAVLED